MLKNRVLLDFTNWRVTKNGSIYSCTINSGNEYYTTLLKAISQGMINGSMMRGVQVCTGSGNPWSQIYSDLTLDSIVYDAPSWQLINPSGSITINFNSFVTGRLSVDDWKNQAKNRIYLEWW